MSKEKILVIDDESGIRFSLKGILEDEGYEVKTAETGESGLNLIESENFDLVFLDIWLPEMNGIDVLEKIKQVEENVQVVMITGHGSVEAAVKSTKMGAFNFLEKPLSLEKVVLTAKNALKQKTLEEENILLREKMRSRLNFIGQSPTIKKIRTQIKTAAPTNGRVLIQGENGTGKELVSRLIHQKSQRKNKRFIQINAAAIPDDLLEDELFGYTVNDSAYAAKNKKGKLLLADKGTLFLDEIGEMSPKTQAKLVRIIEEGEFTPRGSEKPILTDCRVIASTSKNLREMTIKGTFRQDLFYKLSVIPITIPPLRERKEDIPLLIEYFLEFYSMESGKKQKTMTSEAMQAFINYSWPGNVSELSNVIERFVIMIKEPEINTSHLYLLVEPRESQFLPGFNAGPSLKSVRDNFEREYIHKTLVENNWDLSKTATDLKITTNELESDIKRLGIQFLG
ncbi:MAG: sigma-54 dependent transcriptional regulator [Candidatus Aminicenantes bacterium]